MDIIGKVVEATLAPDKRNVVLKIEPDNGDDTIDFTIPRSEASNYGLDTVVRIVQTIKRFRSGAGASGVSVPVFGSDGEPIIDPQTKSAFISKKGIKPAGWRERLEKASKAHGGVANAQQQAKFAAQWRKDHPME